MGGLSLGAEDTKSQRWTQLQSEISRHEAEALCGAQAVCAWSGSPSDWGRELVCGRVGAQPVPVSGPVYSRNEASVCGLDQDWAWAGVRARSVTGVRPQPVTGVGNQPVTGIPSAVQQVRNPTHTHEQAGLDLIKKQCKLFH